MVYLFRRHRVRHFEFFCLRKAMLCYLERIEYIVLRLNLITVVLTRKLNGNTTISYVYRKHNTLSVSKYVIHSNID